VTINDLIALRVILLQIDIPVPVADGLSRRTWRIERAMKAGQAPDRSDEFVIQ
jgi:hypothetical protein